MPSAPRGVLITRPQAEAESTAARLTALGWTPVLAPMLTIRLLTPIWPESIAALALTSGNAVPALPRHLRNLPLFAVGDASATRARTAGFTMARSAGADADALAALIAAEAPRGPILLAVGAGRGGDLATRLRAAGREVHLRAVYTADPVPALPEPAVRALRAAMLTAALFFSAETARIFMARAAAADLLPALAELRACAISRRAVVALQGAAWRELRQAAHPTQDAMLTLLP